MADAPCATAARPCATCGVGPGEAHERENARTQQVHTYDPDRVATASWFDGEDRMG